MSNTENSFSRLLSYILHPLLIPTIASFAMMFRPDLYSIVMPGAMKIWFLSIVFVFTFAVPVTGMLILLKFNIITTLEQGHRSERTIPLLIATTSYMALLFTVKSAGIPPVFLYILYSASFALLAGLMINMVYKISLHTLGWSAMAATLTSISLRMGTALLALIIISVLIAGLAGYARLKQNAHNQSQIYLGYVAGVFVILAISLLG